MLSSAMRSKTKRPTLSQSIISPHEAHHQDVVILVCKYYVSDPFACGQFPCNIRADPEPRIFHRANVTRFCVIQPTRMWLKFKTHLQFQSPFMERLSRLVARMWKVISLPTLWWYFAIVNIVFLKSFLKLEPNNDIMQGYRICYMLG